MEGRIKHLEREWAHPDHSWPNLEAVAHWASLWTAAGLEEFRAKAAAQEFLIHCQSTAEEPTIAALNKWAHCDGAVG